VHVDERVLAPIRARYGEPERIVWSGDVSERELGLVTRNPRRRHDVTLFVENGDRLALIRKPHFEPGVWRTPGGGIKPGEAFAAGVVREGLEETGAEVELRRYLVRADATFRHGGTTIEWQTHVFSAVTDVDELEPLDTEEIDAARWGTRAELAGPIRARLLETGRAFWRYRVVLHDASLAALEG
jgi:ADP-ribose pyrophosphatase YjhB (NUDIX family)